MSQAQAIQYEQSEFVRFWNEVLSEKFNRYQNILMNGLSYHGKDAIDSLNYSNINRILDVGCGWGDTAIEMAVNTGSDGSVLGIDCVDAFLAFGRKQAQTRNIDNVEFVAADVQTYPFQPEFDLCFSRFGMMFFENPVFALRNVRKALKPGGQLVFITWRTIEDNPWFGLPKKIVLNHLPPPAEGGQTCGPGPFSMSNQEVVTAQLAAAGFEDISIERTDGTVMVGRDVEQAIAFQLALGPAGEIFRESGELGIERETEIKQEMSLELTPYLTNSGVIMDSSSWTISAYNPT